MFGQVTITCLTNVHRDSHQKELKNDEEKSKAAPRYSANHPEIEFKVAYDDRICAEFGKIYGFYDITGNFELDFRAIS